MQTKSKIKLVVALILTVIVIILVTQNTQLMTTRFLFWDITMSRSLTLLIVFVLGILTGVLLTIFQGRKRRKAKGIEDAVKQQTPQPPA